ncbi:MAG: DUF349 domain-containing protein [Crocinitomix sp.]|nr:DUF349 domain-containing protein [Crocinitomix sp.]
MKAEIVAQIKTLAEQELVLDSGNAFNDLVTEFYKIQDEEERQWKIKKLERIEAGEKPEAIEKPVYPMLSEFRVFSNLFKEKKKVEIQALKELEKVNLGKKKALIAGFSDLVQNEENIGRAIGRFKDIQESWKEVGPITRDKRQGIQKEFSNLVDTFQYNINIYKEIKDHDLSRNSKLKTEVIEKIKGLLGLQKIKDVEKKLHAYQDEWNGIGGTHQDDWEKIKKDYWDTVNKVYEKIHAFYEIRRNEQAENIFKKRALIAQAQEVTAVEVSSHNDYKKTTDALLALQADWKKIGFGPKQENEAVWAEFRGICNEFFDKKKAFYAQRNGQFGEIKKRKEDLIEEANAMKELTDWKLGAQKIVALQKKWKDVGSAGPKFENQLWKKFRAPIDFFFNAKDGHFNQLDAANAENLAAKEALITELQAYKVDKDPQAAIDALRDFSKRFSEIGNVPFKQKDAIYKGYKKALDEKYDSIDLDKEAKEKMLFQAKLDTMLGSSNSDRLIEQEQQAIRSKIDALNKEVNQFENNLSFFSNADDSNPLFKNVMSSIEKAKAEIEGHKLRLKIIHQATK